MKTSIPSTILDASPQPGAPPLRVMIHHPSHEHYRKLIAAAMPVSVIDAPLEEVAGTVEAVLCWKISADVLDSLTGLRWIQTTSAGVDQVLPYLIDRQRDVLLSTVKGMNAEQVASFALMAILALQWRLTTFLDRQRRHEWRLHGAMPLRSATLGIVGTGTIGSVLAGHARHLGMTVLGMRRSAEPAAGLHEQYTPDRLHEMLPRCNYLVITAPLTEQTRGMMGAEQLALLPQGAGLVNVGRGGIVDEDAVADAVADGWLGGAFLDVFPEEPLPPDSTLWDIPGIVVTPHVAGERTDNNEAVAEIWLGNLRRVVAGAEPRNIVTYTTKPADARLATTNRRAAQ